MILQFFYEELKWVFDEFNGLLLFLNGINTEFLFLEVNIFFFLKDFVVIKRSCEMGV